jgi:hypothetical protein
MSDLRQYFNDGLAAAGRPTNRRSPRRKGAADEHVAHFDGLLSGFCRLSCRADIHRVPFARTAQLTGMPTVPISRDRR